jgi:predicted nucleic acid-binding protein
VSDAWVINASPIILLAKVGLIDRLPRVANPLVVPEAVAAEILRGPSTDPALLWLNAAGREFVRLPVPLPPALSQSAIGPGERAVIAWSLAYPAFIAVLDDRAARIQARQMGVVAIGTAGVLLRLKAAGLIERVNPHLAEIRRVGGHIIDELVSEILLRAGEGSPPNPPQR